MGNFKNHIFVADNHFELQSLNPLALALQNEVAEALGAVSPKRIVDSFIKHDDGNVGKSAVNALRRILRSELSLRGWTLDWKMFPAEQGFQGAPFTLDAFKEVHKGGDSSRAGFKFGWDTINGAGSNLVRADLLRTKELEPNGNRPLDLYLISAPVSAFKERVNFDKNASTVDFYRTLAKAYSGIVKTPTIIMPINDCGGFIVNEYKSGTRKLSKIKLL